MQRKHHHDLEISEFDRLDVKHWVLVGNSELEIRMAQVKCPKHRVEFRIVLRNYEQPITHFSLAQWGISVTAQVFVSANEDVAETCLSFHGVRQCDGRDPSGAFKDGCFFDGRELFAI
jgi:hypothetical protein